MCVCVCDIKSQTPLSMTFYFSLWQFNQSSTTLLQASLILTSSPPSYPSLFLLSLPFSINQLPSVCVSLCVGCRSTCVYARMDSKWLHSTICTECCVLYHSIHTWDHRKNIKQKKPPRVKSYLHRKWEEDSWCVTHPAITRAHGVQKQQRTEAHRL